MYQSSKTVKRQSKQQKWPLVYQSSQVYQDCTNSVPTMYQSSITVNRQSKQKKWPLMYQSSQVYQDCTNSVPIVKNSQKQWKHSQNNTKMTSRNMSTKTVPTVYQQCTKNRQNTVKTAKMTISVPIVTGLKRLYQQCNNSVPIVRNRQKQSNSKKWPLVYQASHIYTGSVEYTKSASAVCVRRIYKAKMQHICIVLQGTPLRNYTAPRQHF